MTNSNAVPPDTSIPKRPRIRGRERLNLIGDLAAGLLTGTQLAEKYDRHATQISEFKTRNADEIQAVRDAGGNLLAALWAAQKEQRIAELQRDIEAVADALDDEDVPPDAALLRAKHSALRQIAEELGQLTVKVDTTQQVTYRLEGVNTDDLR